MTSVVLQRVWSVKRDANVPIPDKGIKTKKYAVFTWLTPLPVLNQPKLPIVQ